MALVRSKLAAVSYTTKGQDFESLFTRQVDKDRSGEVDEKEFLSFVRRVLKLGPNALPDDRCAKLFRVLDFDGSGEIAVEELEKFAHSGALWGGYGGGTRKAAVDDHNATFTPHVAAAENLL